MTRKSVSFPRMNRAGWMGWAVAVCALVACSQVQQYETPPSGSEHDDLVVARVGSKDIRVRDLNFKIKVQLPAMLGVQGPQDVRQKQEVLKQMIEQYCWVDLGEKKGYDQDAEFLGTLDLSRNYILANHAADREVYDKVEISDEEVRTFYDENLDQYQTEPWAKARVILTAKEQEARRIYERLLAGDDFQTLARQYSIDETSNKLGGELGTVAGSVPVKGFPNFRAANRAILDLEVGGISEPLETPRGWALFSVYERDDGSLQDFERVKESIRDNLYKKRVNALFSSTLEDVRSSVGAEVIEESWVRYAVSLLNDAEIRAMAKNERDPQTRIYYYRGLVDEHPESSSAGLAAFMIGFIQADELERYDEARASFRAMLDAYPNHELAESATWMIDNMEKGLDALPSSDQIKRKILEG